MTHITFIDYVIGIWAFLALFAFAWLKILEIRLKIQRRFTPEDYKYQSVRSAEIMADKMRSKNGNA